MTCNRVLGKFDLFKTHVYTRVQVMENDLMDLDIVKQLDLAKDLAQALAYLHAQVNLISNLISQCESMQEVYIPQVSPGPWYVGLSVNRLQLEVANNAQNMWPPRPLTFRFAHYPIMLSNDFGCVAQRESMCVRMASKAYIQNAISECLAQRLCCTPFHETRPLWCRAFAYELHCHTSYWLKLTSPSSPPGSCCYPCTGCCQDAMHTTKQAIWGDAEQALQVGSPPIQQQLGISCLPLA